MPIQRLVELLPGEPAVGGEAQRVELVPIEVPLWRASALAGLANKGELKGLCHPENLRA